MKKLLASAVLGAGALALLNAPSANAAPTFYFGDGKKLTIFQMVQVWNVYTLENEGKSYNDANGNPQDPDARNDLYIRRGRIGVKGNISKNIKYKVWFAYDNLGKDRQTASTGGNSQDTYDNREFYIWDAIWTWVADPEWANISIGYFRPQVGKESITTAFKVISFQKALTNFQPRRHIVYRGPGRETGVNIGGLALNKQLNYNFGIFDTSEYTGNNKDKKWSPMLAARVAWSFGDPEMKKYKMGYTQTYYGKRNGVTVGLNYTYQGETDYFDSNTMYGVDVLANFGPIDFNAEYDVLKRDNLNTQGGTPTGVDYENIDWSVKLGYNIKMQNGQIVRPAVMYSVYDADDSAFAAAGINKNNSSNYRIHKSLLKDVKMYEISLNWLINKDKLKVNAAYNYEEVGKGASKKKNSYIGIGFQFIY